MTQVRVRFAPSPTGPLHIGGLRTALFNYLFAKKHGGTFILRIEDTDQKRYIESAENYIIESLKWCGIEPDEGVNYGGDMGPYRQSERKADYAHYAEKLINSGKAYYAFDTTEKLNEMRSAAEQNKAVFTYDAKTRGDLENSLTLTADETKKRIERGDPYVIRFKFENDRELVMNDQVRGEVIVNTNTLDDKILFKSDGMPTYHLANVVDDYLMKISHVIRGEEWLPSLPLHVALYEAFDWESEMPEFAHLPLILKPNGKGKLSKRDGDKGGFPVFPINWNDPKSGELSPGFRESGYYPEACINILAFLGWNPGTEQEIYSLEELVNSFDISRVGRAGAKFDPEKATWFNHQYLQQQPVKSLSEAYMEILQDNGVEADKKMVEKVVDLVRERVSFISELWDQSWFFFKAPDAYDPKVVKKRWKEQTPELMRALADIISEIDPFTAENIELSVKHEIEVNEWGMGAVMNAWRLVLVGTSMGPSLFQLAEILGKEEVINRIMKGVEHIQR